MEVLPWKSSAFTMLDTGGFSGSRLLDSWSGSRSSFNGTGSYGIDNIPKTISWMGSAIDHSGVDNGPTAPGWQLGFLHVRTSLCCYLPENKRLGIMRFCLAVCTNSHRV